MNKILVIVFAEKHAQMNILYYKIIDNEISKKNTSIFENIMEVSQNPIGGHQICKYFLWFGTCYMIKWWKTRHWRGRRVFVIDVLRVHSQPALPKQLIKAPVILLLCPICLEQLMFSSETQKRKRQKLSYLRNERDS